MYDVYDEEDNPQFCLGIDKICPVCNKKFLMHMYKMHRYNIKSKNGVNKIPVCSWSCLRAHEEKVKTDAARKKEEKIKRQLMGYMK